MPKRIETARLVLRPLCLEDYAFLRTLHTDPEVMKFIGTGSGRTEEQTQEGMRKTLKLAEDTPVLGGWIVELKGNGQPIGNCIVREPATAEKLAGIEIGYMFAKAHWGKGYATEVTQGMVDYIKRELGEVCIVALIEPHHQASRHTLQKVGFQTIAMDTYVDPATGNKLPTELLELLK